MKQHVQVAVIGGGVVGCSVLYHLTKRGYQDAVLVERAELTSGSTWHAAGGMHTLNSDPNVAKLQDYTIRLYEEIEKISGQSCGIHITGGYMLADTAERMDFLKTAHAKARYLGLATRIVSIEEAAEANPLIDPAYFTGAMYDPFEGHVDPSGVTQAYAKAARLGGAEVYRHNRVTALRQTRDGGWQLTTEKGQMYADIVVNAGGLWAREVGRMVGVELPLLAMQHQYLVTEDLPLTQTRDKELPHCIDFGGEIYMRQEQKGLVLGTYEQDCVPWSPQQTPWDFDMELLPADLDRIAPRLEVAFQHFPALAEAGIKRVINGPFTFTPDGNPLVGPVRGLRNYWVACGVMAGFSQGGGVGLALANWIADGDPGSDVFAMDVARFGAFADEAYTHAKVQENYRRRFSIVYPNEELPAARPKRTTPVYERLKARRAVFGAVYGLEQALWFAPVGMEPVETLAFKRSNAFAPVAKECKNVREAVGLLEISGFAKYVISGPGARAWLNHMLANHMPPPGRITLAPMLNSGGRIIGDFTVAALGEVHDRQRDSHLASSADLPGECFMIFGSGLAENYHMRWWEAHQSRDVRIRNLCTEVCGLAIAGPRARELLQRVTSGVDVSGAAFAFMSVRAMDVGEGSAAVPALVGRISFTGELGYEIWVRPEYQVLLFDALLAAGEGLGLQLFGARALNSLRLEKSFGSWTREYTPDYTPLQAGLGRFIAWDKNDFIGREALLRTRDAMDDDSDARQLVSLTIEAADADAFADEPLLYDGNVVGWITSGSYGHCVGKSIAMGYLPARLAHAGQAVQAEILGDMREATVSSEALYDPTGLKMRKG